LMDIISRKACMYIRDITDAVLCTVCSPLLLFFNYYCFDVAPLIVKDCREHNTT
jgi:hypothetical protein